MQTIGDAGKLIRRAWKKLKSGRIWIGSNYIEAFKSFESFIAFGWFDLQEDKLVELVFIRMLIEREKYMNRCNWSDCCDGVQLEWFNLESEPACFMVAHYKC